MADRISVTLVMSLEDAYSRGSVLGFNSVAAAKGWEVRIVSPLVFAAEEKTATNDPHAYVLGRTAWVNVPQSRWGKVPLVGLGADLTALGHYSILPNNIAVGRAAAEHLMARGLRQFASLSIEPYSFSVLRTRGFRERIREAKLSYVTSGEMPLDMQEKRHFAPRLAQWVRTLPRSIGVLACCDDWGMLLTDCCRVQGLRVPEDVAILGVDNDELKCELSHPALSSVMVPFERMGAEAALALDRQLKRPRTHAKAPVLVPPAGVVTRRSTDMLAVDDPEVAAVLAYIQRHSARAIRVSDILRDIPAYRKGLERKFKLHVNRSMLQEIRRVHVENAKRLLATTDLQIDEVAAQSGFQGRKKLSEHFRNETGATPSEYRVRFRLRP